jgi:hypothetical protein
VADNITIEMLLKREKKVHELTGEEFASLVVNTPQFLQHLVVQEIDRRLFKEAE